MPAALAERAEALGQGFAGSLTMGAGQFCTNPGIVLGLDGPELDRFLASAREALRQAPPQTMLTAGIYGNYQRGLGILSGNSRLELIAEGVPGIGCNQAAARIFAIKASDFKAHPELADEVFGPSSIVIRCVSLAELASVVEGLEGQLTATLQMDDADLDAARSLLPLLERKAGRILANAWPTGVEVSHAMVHGGPFPATSDSRSTSVGASAIDRFLRPVCYQDLPDALLPDALKHANPLEYPRFVS